MENEELEQQLNDQLNAVEQDEPEEVEQEAPQDEQEIEQHEPEDKPLSRAEQRFQKLANERAEEKARRELAEKQAEFYRQQAERLSQQTQRQQEEDLDPDEKWRREANAAIRQTQMMAADMADKAEFLSKYSKDPEIIAMQDAIEAKMAEVRSQGHNPKRENVLTFLLGQQALEKRAKAPAIKKEAAARVKAAQGQPLNSKSNVASTKSSQTLYERLKDIPL